MICIIDCTICKHNREYKADGWRATCDAFPDGIPLNFDFNHVKEMKVCNPENKIGFEEETSV